jgi:hypothetical protein
MGTLKLNAGDFIQSPSVGDGEINRTVITEFRHFRSECMGHLITTTLALTWSSHSIITVPSLMLHPPEVDTGSLYTIRPVNAPT